MTHPESGQHYPICWGLRMNKGRDRETTSILLSLPLSTGLAGVPNCTCFLNVSPVFNVSPGYTISDLYGEPFTNLAISLAPSFHH